MYFDLSFNDWNFEIDQTNGKHIADRLREVWKDYDTAITKLKLSMNKVESIYRERTASLKNLMVWTGLIIYSFISLVDVLHSR